MPLKVKRDPSLDVDWKSLADGARAEAAKLPEGLAKETLLRKARQLDTASHMEDWIKSPGVAPPHA